MVLIGVPAGHQQHSCAVKLNIAARPFLFGHKDQPGQNLLLGCEVEKIKKSEQHNAVSGKKLRLTAFRVFFSRKVNIAFSQICSY
jgi:hypothetical protein